MSHSHLEPIGRDALISPRFKASDWRQLNLPAGRNPNWTRGVEIFLDRIHGRFLAPIDAIRFHEDARIAEFSGFAIVGIDCLLIETLVQFARGEDETSGWHGDAFAEFFSKSSHFRPYFDSRSKALLFYNHFRCGILHQAQTKKRSLIRYGLPTMVEFAVPGTSDEGLVLDRELFHLALVREIHDYAERIRAGKTGNDTLRARFVKKMNFIAQRAPVAVGVENS